MTPAPVEYDSFEKRFRNLQLRYSRSKRHIIYVAIGTIVLFGVFVLCCLLKTETYYVFDYEHYFGGSQESRYIVDTPNCRILDHEAFSDDLELYKAQMNYSIEDHPGTCGSLPPLSSVSRHGNGHTLHLYKERFINHTSAVKDVFCCYSYIFSSALLIGEEENATVDEPKYMPCKKLDEDVELDPDFDFVRVTCGTKQDFQGTPPSDIYKQFHSYVSRKREVRTKMDLYNETIRLGKKFENDSEVPPWEKPWSVSIIGLDSVSRLNLVRMMPRTVDYLEKSGWYALEGYNKVGDTTFPNLAAAVLAGSTEEQLRRTCAPKETSAVDWCPWIWGKFSGQGYITAYGEDETKRDTFYLHSGGFKHPPTDYFLRTLIKAADTFTSGYWYEKLIQYYDCVGLKHHSEYIFDFSLEFAEALKFYPTFSLFWFNSFSHERLFGPKPMDEYIRSYLQNLTSLMDDTIIVFMSDHGMSHGFYRQTEMGFFENNLPFLYIWLPESFKELNPLAVKTLVENKHKLTSHFDLHLTLLDLLGDGSRAPGCPKCRSLFQPVPSNRTCEDAGVPLRYCACNHYTSESNDHQHLAEFLVTKINAIIQPLKQYIFEEFRCANMSLKKINSIKKVVPTVGDAATGKPSPQGNSVYGTATGDYYVVSIVTEPKALFEAMIYKNDSMHIIDTILRLDPFEKDSRCLNYRPGRPYCVCYGKVDVLKLISDDEKKIDDEMKLSAKKHKVKKIGVHQKLSTKKGNGKKIDDVKLSAKQDNEKANDDLKLSTKKYNEKKIDGHLKLSTKKDRLVV